MTVNHEIALSILAATGILGLLTLIAVYLMIAFAWDDFQNSIASRASSEPPASSVTLVKFALARRCPRCGRGAIAHSLFLMNEVCPACGIAFWRNEGEWMGPAVINYTAALAGALASWALTVLLDCAAAAQLIVPTLAAVAAGIGVAPWSRSFWTLFLYLSGEIAPEES